MARIRSIKPEFFTSTAIAALSERARLAFVGLWTHCDDEGRCLDEPRLIKAALFPLDDKVNVREVDRVLDELSRNGRLLRYEGWTRDRRTFVEDSSKVRLVQIIGWDHQKIDRKTRSKYTSPEEAVGWFDDDSTSAR